jgi:hypothetical protein
MQTGAGHYEEPYIFEILRGFLMVYDINAIELKYATNWDNLLPQRKPRLSPSRRKMSIKDISADYEAGGSLRELAAKYGVDKKTVALQLKRAGVKLRLPGCNVWRQPLGGTDAL